MLVKPLGLGLADGEGTGSSAWESIGAFMGAFSRRHSCALSSRERERIHDGVLPAEDAGPWAPHFGGLEFECERVAIDLSDIGETSCGRGVVPRHMALVERSR